MQREAVEVLEKGKREGAWKIWKELLEETGHIILSLICLKKKKLKSRGVKFCLGRLCRTGGD